MALSPQHPCRPTGSLQPSPSRLLPWDLMVPYFLVNPHGAWVPDGGTSWPRDPLRNPPTGPITQHRTLLPPLCSSLRNPRLPRDSLSSPVLPYFCSPFGPGGLPGDTQQDPSQLKPAAALQSP